MTFLEHGKRLCITKKCQLLSCSRMLFSPLIRNIPVASRAVKMLSTFSFVLVLPLQATTSKGEMVWRAKYNGPNAERVDVGEDHGRCFLAMLDNGEMAYFVGPLGAADKLMKRAWTTDGCRRAKQALGAEGRAVLLHDDGDRAQ